MDIKRIYLLITVLVFCFPFIAHSQTGTAGNLLVKSDPPGAEVTLNGEAIVSGITPVQFFHTLIGEYDITIKKHGYESYHTKVVLDPSKQMELNISLSKKTRIKASARSLIIPGWGQRYAGNKFRGNLYTFLAIGTAIGYYFADQDFDREYDRYKVLEKEFDKVRTSGNQSELNRIYPLMIAQQDKAYDKENIRRAAIGSVIAVWGISFIDALFFFPEEKGTFSVKSLSISPEANPKQIGINLSLAF